MAGRKYHYEERWGEVREKLDVILSEVAHKFPEVYADLDQDYQNAESFLDAINDVLYDLDYGEYDE